MKQVFLVVLAIVIGAVNAIAFELPLKFAWDADENGVWEEVRIYARSESGQYDYDNPIVIIPQSYGTDGLSTPTITPDTAISFTDNTSSTVYFVARACKDTECSENSEEISHTMNLTPLAAPTYTAVFNEVAKSIDFTWETGSDDRIVEWKILTSLQSGGPYEELATVDNSGSTSVDIDSLFPDREKTTRYFTMVAVGKYVSGVEGSEIAISMNRVPPSGVINFKIILE